MKNSTYLLFFQWYTLGLGNSTNITPSTCTAQNSLSTGRKTYKIHLCALRLSLCVSVLYTKNLIIYISCFQTSQTNEIQREDSDSSILEACGIIKKPVNVEKLVFGATLSKHHVASIEVKFLTFFLVYNLFIKFWKTSLKAFSH